MWDVSALKAVLFYTLHNTPTHLKPGDMSQVAPGDHILYTIRIIHCTYDTRGCIQDVTTLLPKSELTNPKGCGEHDRIETRDSLRPSIVCPQTVSETQ